MLLSIHLTSVLFLVQFNNFAFYGLLLELHALTLVTRSYALLHITTCLTSVTLTCLIFVLDVAQKSRRYFYVRVRAWEEANTEAAIEI